MTQNNKTNTHKIKKFSKIPLSERTIDSLQKQKDLYEASVDDYKNDPDWLQISNSLFKLEEKRSKELERLKREEIKLNEALAGSDTNDKEHIARVAIWTKYLEDNELYFIRDSGMYVEYRAKSGQWITSTVNATLRFFGATSVKEQSALNEAMGNEKRNKLTATYSFNKQNDEVLNMMKTDHWLQPKKGEYNEIFDIIMTSISGGRQDVRDNLEQALYWKHKYPEIDGHKLPCFIIFGTGGVGKNEFIDKIVTTLFGSEQVKSISTDEIFGQFTGMLRGNVVTFVDEVISSKSDANKAKRIVGNNTISINNKGGKQEVIDNTSLYFMGGNDTTGALVLDGHGADRRWTIIKTDKDIIEHVQEKYELNRENALSWYEDRSSHYTNPQQVSAWLESIYAKWDGVIKYVPRGIKTEDYDNLLEVQTSPIDDAFNAIFKDPNFSNITGKDLVTTVQLFVAENHPKEAKEGVIGRNKVHAAAREFIRKKKLGIKSKYYKYVSGSTRTGYCLSSRTTKYKCTTPYYYTIDDNGVKTLKLPEHTFDENSPGFDSSQPNIVDLFDEHDKKK